MQEQRDKQREHGGKQPSSAPNSSWESGAGAEATGFDSPPESSEGAGSTYLSNPELRGPEHAQPYYPPGSRQGDTPTPADAGKRHRTTEDEPS